MQHKFHLELIGDLSNLSGLSARLWAKLMVHVMSGDMAAGRHRQNYERR
jgi:hypothetical protein